MSILKVDTLQPATGARVLSAGHIIQVVDSIKTATAITTTSSSFAATGHSVSITPTSSSSKVLLMVNGGGHYLTTAAQFAVVTIYRDSTNIGHATHGLESSYTTSGSAFSMNPHSISIVDSPSTTSAITYQTYIKTASGTYQFHNTDRGSINFVAMEIAQ
mgnify:CR=1 FL=1|tara:strand:- start:29 stop:508 length:480 start_codon:yes stop_codon:yes gene_type:complete